MILVSSAEPARIRLCGESSSIPESYGADVLILSPGASESPSVLGLQRKQFPGDFLSSMQDGRLSTSLTKLASSCDLGLLVLEGTAHWDTSGRLISRYGPKNFTRPQLWGLLSSAAWVLGISTLWTSTITETVELVTYLEGWAAKPDHRSLTARPPNRKPRQSERDRAIWLLQGVPGVGPKRAADLYDHFGYLPLTWTVAKEELEGVDGIGPGTAERLIKAVEE